MILLSVHIRSIHWTFLYSRQNRHSLWHFQESRRVKKGNHQYHHLHFLPHHYPGSILFLWFILRCLSHRLHILIDIKPLTVFNKIGCFWKSLSFVSSPLGETHLFKTTYYNLCHRFVSLQLDKSILINDLSHQRRIFHVIRLIRSFSTISILICELF